MNTGLLIPFFLLGESVISIAQEDVMKILADRSDIITAITVLEQGIETSGEDGVIEQPILAEVITCYKGSLQPKEKIRFNTNRFEFLKDDDGKIIEEQPKLELGKRCIVFLSGQSGEWRAESDDKLHPLHRLTDRWMGIQQFEPYVEHFLLEKQTRSKQ